MEPVSDQRGKCSKPATGFRARRRHRFLPLLAAVSLTVASCGQDQATTDAAPLESTAENQPTTEQTLTGQSEDDTAATPPSTTPGSTTPEPTAPDATTPLSNPPQDNGSTAAEPTSSEQPQASTPAPAPSTTEQRPAETTPAPAASILPAIAMTDVGANSTFSLDQLSGQGDILLWFYLPT